MGTGNRGAATVELRGGYLHPLGQGEDELAIAWQRACETIAQAVGRHPETSLDPAVPEVRRRVICHQCDCDSQQLEAARRDDATYLGLVAKAVDLYQVF
ncbi:MAG: hypothetical protein ACFB0C_16285 [Leptolyngbyaceae cyanobacterium]